jgi:hypothetical protein
MAMHTHATITTNVGGAAVIPRHHSMCLVAGGPTPLYRSFDGVHLHATIMCFFSASFWFFADSISIFQARRTNTKFYMSFYHSKFHPNLIEKTPIFSFKFALYLIRYVCSSGAAIS